jgi:hypothetical protein
VGALPEGVVKPDRRSALDELYGSIEKLREHLGGPRRLAEASADSDWPDHGIYLFFENREIREDCITPRVTRVGTHARTERSRTTLWKRCPSTEARSTARPRCRQSP